jgi:hypothetical protein
VETAFQPILNILSRIDKVTHGLLSTLAFKPAFGMFSLTNSDGKSAAGDAAADKLRTAAGALARARVVGGLKGDELQKAGDSLSDSLAAGIQQGLISHAEAVKLQGIALGKEAVEGAKKGAESHSPSRATMRLGRFVGEGLAIGMRSSGSAVDRAGVYLAERATRMSRPDRAGLYMSGERAGRVSFYPRPERDRRGEAYTRVGGSSGVTVERAEVNITAPAGVTDAAELSAWGLSVALERQELMGGG